METKFSTYDKIIYRVGTSAWKPSLFGFYRNNGDSPFIIGEGYIPHDNYEILPYEGNEHLIGTKLGKNYESINVSDAIFASDYSLCESNPTLWYGGVLLSVEDDYIKVGCGNETRKAKYIVKLKHFNPLLTRNMLDHILTVKDGILVGANKEIDIRGQW